MISYPTHIPHPRVYQNPYANVPGNDPNSFPLFTPTQLCEMYQQAKGEPHNACQVITNPLTLDPTWAQCWVSLADWVDDFPNLYAGFQEVQSYLQEEDHHSEIGFYSPLPALMGIPGWDTLWLNPEGFSYLMCGDLSYGLDPDEPLWPRLEEIASQR